MLRKSLLVALALLVVFGCEQKKPVTEGMDLGQAAPALEGNDTTGQAIRLSDQRGKVVLVDFWATWCGPCVQMVPHEKELVQRLEGQPFLILGVSADHEQDDLKKFLNEKGIAWPNIYDGLKGPLADAWQVHAFPTIFIIDAKGIIRFKQEGYGPASASKIDNAIDKLLREARY
ncbi:MAG TPA: TlpA disulfide reductase family protein [Gemmataceae bacterium]|jgi:thiol-disulfide isomerase/thioredoxin|nr:TlpA disulfide reductase family protein [Gemmataceae bacterium]